MVNYVNETLVFPLDTICAHNLRRESVWMACAQTTREEAETRGRKGIIYETNKDSRLVSHALRLTKETKKLQPSDYLGTHGACLNGGLS